MRICRALLWVMAGAAALQVAGILLAAGVSGGTLGAAVWAGGPGALAVWCARRLPSGSRNVQRAVVGLQAFALAAALGVIGFGDPRGVAELALPIAILVALRYARRSDDAGWIRAEAGEGAVSYLGVLLLVCAIIVALVTTNLPGTVASGIKSAVCKVTATGCATSASPAPDSTAPVILDGPGTAPAPGPSSTGGTATPNGPGGGVTTPPGPSSGSNPPGPSSGSGPSGPSSGGGPGPTTAPGQVLPPAPSPGAPPPTPAPAPPHSSSSGGGGSVWDDIGGGFSWAGDQIGGFFSGAADGAWQNIQGIGNLVSDPVGSAENIGTAIWNDPWGTAQSMVGLDQQTKDDWNKGNYGSASGRLAWGVGSWFIPFGDIAAKAGALGKGGELAADAAKAASKAGEVASDVDKAAQAASAADKAAAAGDLAGAQKAEAEADKAAQNAEDQANKDGGCPLVLSLGRSYPQLVDFGRTGVTMVLDASLRLPMDAPPDECAKTDQTRQSDGQARKAVLRIRLSNLGLSQEQIDALLSAIKDKDKGTLSSLEKTLDATSDPAKVAGIQKTLADLATLIQDKAAGPNTVQGILNKLNTAAKGSDPTSIASLSAEVAQAVDVAKSGGVMPGTTVAVGAKGSTSVGKGVPPIELPPLLDADNAWRDTSGVDHVAEVKATMNALLSELRDGSQADKLQAWASQSGHAAEFVVRDGSDAGDLFRYPDLLDRLINSGVPLRIGDKVYDSNALRAAKANGHF